MTQTFKIEDFLSGSRSGKIVNFDKQSIIDRVQPDSCQLYYLYDQWRIALLNSKTNDRFPMNINKLDVPKNVQTSATKLNAAAKTLELLPTDNSALKVVSTETPKVAAWVSEVFDNEDHYVYCGESVEGRKFSVLSPNAPGTNTGIATVAYTSELQPA